MYFFCIFLIQFCYSQKVIDLKKSTTNGAISAKYTVGLELVLKENFEEAYSKITAGLEASKKIQSKNLISFWRFKKERWNLLLLL